MSETTYFWQGGRKIAVRHDETAVTIHADTPNEASAAASEAGVELHSVQPAAPGLVRAEVAGNRDDAMDRLRASRNVVHHVYRQAEAPENEYIVTESFFLKFKEDTPAERIQQYIEAERLVVEQTLDEKTFLVRVTDATGRNPLRTANAAATRDDVEYAEPNLVRQLTRFAFIPSDSLFADQWHLHAPSATTDLVAGAGTFAADAWDITRGRREIVIAVADDGFDLTHPDFQGTGKVAAQLNAKPRSSSAVIDWDADVRPRGGAAPHLPGDYHGTPCLGVAVAEANGSGTVGVAPGCALVAVRFPLSMEEAHFITMFRKVSTLADVMSCSWGYGPGDFGMSTPLSNAITEVATTGGRRGKGLVICVAAGNDNCPVQDLGNTRTYRYRRSGVTRSYTGPVDRWIAAHPNVITVSASTSRKTRSAYSSWGNQISVCAPSDNWDDLDELVPAPAGLGITTTDNEGFGHNSDFTGSSRFTNQFGGTSSATPTVAGVCALVLSANSALTASEVKALLEANADKDLSLITDTPVNEPGDFNANGFSLWFGHGKVNALRAVQAANTGNTQVVDMAAQPNELIPDVGSVVTSTIDIAQNGSINDLRVQVDITHTYIGDLRVDLIAPDGTGIALHNNEGGSAQNLVKTYGVAENPVLQALVGKPVRGQWQLRVRDTFRLDEGRLNRWRIVARVA